MKCSNVNIGAMIGRYEFGLLNEREMKIFDDHLLECDACYQDYYEFQSIQNVLQENRKKFYGILHRAYLIRSVQRFISSVPAKLTQLFRINRPVMRYSLAAVSIGILLIVLIPVMQKQTSPIQQEDLITLHGYQTEVLETTGHHIYSESMHDQDQEQRGSRIDICIEETNQSVIFKWRKDPQIYTYDVEIFQSGADVPLFVAQGVQNTAFTIPVKKLSIGRRYQVMLTGKGKDDRYFRITKDFKLE